MIELQIYGKEIRILIFLDIKNTLRWLKKYLKYLSNEISNRKKQPFLH